MIQYNGKKRKRIAICTATMLLLGAIAAWKYPEYRFFQKLEQARKSGLVDVPRLANDLHWDKLIILTTHDSSWITGCAGLEKQMNVRIPSMDENRTRFMFIEKNHVIRTYEKRNDNGKSGIQIAYHCKTQQNRFPKIYEFKRDEAVFIIKDKEAAPNCEEGESLDLFEFDPFYFCRNEEPYSVF